LRQNAALFWGCVACLGQPCQKQPSTKTANFNRGKTKSGLPVSVDPRRQPTMPAERMTMMSRSSVALLPRDRMADITADRFRREKISAMMGRQQPGLMQMRDEN
jgi:hypothetical protein